MTTHSVALTGVGKRYGAVTALEDVGLRLEPGVTGLLGPNGAGKTTLLRILATVLAPSSGEVRLLDLDPEDPAERRTIRRSLGYLPQETGYPRGFTAFRFVDYIAALKEWADTDGRHGEVRRVLDQVGLGTCDEEDASPVRRAAPPGRAGAGSDRRAVPAGPRRADHGCRP